MGYFLVAHDKRGVSATYIARELELTYPTAWLLLQKIRKAMGDRDANYRLAGLVELDDAFFGAPTEGGKRGRGTEQTPVLVGVSLDKQGLPLYVKMQVIPNVKGKTLLFLILPNGTSNRDQQSVAMLIVPIMRLLKITTIFRLYSMQKKIRTI